MSAKQRSAEHFLMISYVSKTAFGRTLSHGKLCLQNDIRQNTWLNWVSRLFFIWFTEIFANTVSRLPNSELQNGDQN